MNENLHEIKRLPVLALRGLVAFPNMLVHFDVGRLISVKALEIAMKNDQMIFLTTQQDIRIDVPQYEDLFTLGTICYIKQILKLPGDNIRVLVEGKYRAHLHSLETEEDCLFGDVANAQIPPIKINENRKEALIRTLKDSFEEYCEYAPRISNDVVLGVMSSDDMEYLSDFIMQNLSTQYLIKQEVLEEISIPRRIQKVIRILHNETEVLKLETEIQGKLRTVIDKNQKDYLLREQLKVIQSELGENEDLNDEINEYREKIYNLHLVDDIAEKLYNEVNRLSKMNSTSAESSVIRTYLDACIALPWNKKTSDKKVLESAEKVLNDDHYGLEKVKERIIELLAVRKLKPEMRGQVICLVGPPGVGKTSIAKSIARAMGRKYARLSLGGVRDEAEIRGHRKTYVGAMPGRIMNGMKNAGSKNPVLLLDEIDKMGNDFKGDPSSAMLEVLDIEQNYAFRDHYIELPFDLSEVLFITTANDLSTVPRPLLDRMEIIEVSGYTDEEKLQIAKRHLLPKQLEKHGLRKANFVIADDELRYVISRYTRESGVRKLEQILAKLCRKVAKIVADGTKKKITLNQKQIKEFLGPNRYKGDHITNIDEIGIVNGLAWTSVGGEILQVEVNVVDGTGKIEITGNLGRVMQESAKAAVTYTRSRASDLGIDGMFYKDKDIHIHFPEAAIPKDGPSAGITMTTAIISALTNRKVRHDVAMTGEVTLRGRVLPIGGLREKTMAAYRAGIKTVIVPYENKADLQEIDKTVFENLDFIIAEDMEKVLKTALLTEEKKIALKVSTPINPVETNEKSINTTDITQ